jgi:hypothetical protein
LLLRVNLEFVVHPNAESVKEAAGAGDDRASLQWRFLNLHQKVKIRPKVGALRRVSEKKRTLMFCKAFGVTFHPRGKFFFNACLVVGDGIRAKILVSIGVLEMIREGEPKVGVALDDSGPKIFVAVDDEKIFLVAEQLKAITLVTEEVWSDFRGWTEGRVHSAFEARNPGVKVAWYIVGYPFFRRDVHPRVVFFGFGGWIERVVVDEKASEDDSSFETREGPCLVSMKLRDGSRCLGRWNEFQTEAQEGTKIFGRGQGGGQVVEG